MTDYRDRYMCILFGDVNGLQ
ncbi:hypothetical protein [Staphylococcus equorum]